MEALEFIAKHYDKGWRYVGPAEGKGDVQKVMSAGDEEVISVSMAYAWLGSPQRFVQEFRLVN